LFKILKIKKLKIDYEEEVKEKSFRTRKKIKKIFRKKIKVQESRKKSKICIKNSIIIFHFNHKLHHFYMWVLHVGIKSSSIINIRHNMQYLHVTHTIGVGFGNSKPL